MQHKITTPQVKFLLLSPLPLFFLATLVFWLLGGGQTSSDVQLGMLENFNIQIPIAKPGQAAPENKLSYYKKADTKKVSWRTIDQRDTALNAIVKKSDISLNIPSEHDIERTAQIMGAQEIAEKEVELQQKLQKIQQLVGQNDPSLNVMPRAVNNFNAIPESNLDLERLEEIMIQISSPETKDPELTQLNDLLERVLDIQHPRRVTRRLETSKNKISEVQYTAIVSNTSVPISCLGAKPYSSLYNTKLVDFYGVDGDFQQDQETQNTIAAVVHKAQDVTEGSKVALRLDQEITLEGTKIPKGHIIYAKAFLFQDRLMLNVDGIKQGFSLFPVSLVAYGTDGLKGIYVPGAVATKTSKESGSNFLQRLGITPFNNSLEGKITNAGIQATKKIFSKKVKEERVRIKAGDRVLLKYE